MSQVVEVLGRVERRRRFSVEQKLAVLAEAARPDANVSAVARRHGLTPSQLFKWRRLAELGVIGIAGASELPSFVAMQVASDAATTSTPRPPASEGAWHPHEAGLIEIDLGDSRRVRVDRHVDAAALERVLTVLARR